MHVLLMHSTAHHPSSGYLLLLQRKLPAKDLELTLLPGKLLLLFALMPLGIFPYRYHSSDDVKKEKVVHSVTSSIYHVVDLAIR